MKLFDHQPLVIAALHLPDFDLSRHLSIGWYEDFAIANARVFAEAGIPWIKLQDQTRTAGPVAPETLARLSALARLIRREIPDLGLGIIVEAHDPLAALSVAQASGADFVRLKVFVGGAMTADGPRNGMGAAAVSYRRSIGAERIVILADVHDRTARPLSDESQPVAAAWASKTGADGLIITGASFPDSCARIEAVRAAGVRRPILVGGGVSAENVAQALAFADGVIVSSALMRSNPDDNDLLRWDLGLCHRFMQAAGAE